MIGKNEFAQMSRELNLMEAESVAGQAQSERYKKSVANEMMQCGRGDINQFQVVRYRIKKSLWSRIMDWFDRFTNII